MLRTTETQTPVLTATRSTIQQFYDLIFADLQYAVDNLPNSWGNELQPCHCKIGIGIPGARLPVEGLLFYRR